MTNISFRPNELDAERIKIINEFIADDFNSGAIRFSLKKAVEYINGLKPKPVLCPKHNVNWISCGCDN